MNTPAGLHDYLMLPVAALAPYARNARTHSPAQVAQIAASMREFGWTNPVLIDAGNGIIAGHGRVLAAQALGMAHVQCLRLSHLSPAQARAYVLADNQLAMNAGWDAALLAAELAALESLDFDLPLIGFPPGVLAELLGDDIAPAGGDAALPAGDEPEFTKITLSLSAADAAAVRRALAAVDVPAAGENRNGAAAALICRQWMAAHGHG